MTDFRNAYGLAAPAEPSTGRARGAPSAAMDAPRLASWRGEIDEKTARRFRAGPSDPRGVLVDCSDRPLLCLSVSDDGRDVVVGGAAAARSFLDGALVGGRSRRRRGVPR